MATQSSREEATFLETYIFVWHVYCCPWSDQPSLHLDNYHLKKSFQYYPIIMHLLIKNLAHIKGVLQNIKQHILQGRLYSFKRVLHAYNIPYVQTVIVCLRI